MEKKVFDINMYVCFSFQLLKQLRDFHETWQDKCYATGDHPSVSIISNDIVAVRTCQVGATLVTFQNHEAMRNRKVLKNTQLNLEICLCNVRHQHKFSIDSGLLKIINERLELSLQNLG